ncbi:ribbon-helix-helix domain-containing protein [Anabaena cylindrica UHCC 0172]|uniref:ribbon-helix-helix domain-containing protein n=1 Tax=Anabaena TaxID=1163 RepID=UPI002B213100|nr:ribbon-helix-helix domain-containing protein [Anabaena cylindrica]MEA5551853.1 ribbon-helix-helix domain-containing protein [Anabaena cylindrica UHCC 0172]
MVRPRKAEKDKYGEPKQRYQIMLTETASTELDRVSEKLGITRSELVEQVIRQGLLELVKIDITEY